MRVVVFRWSMGVILFRAAVVVVCSAPEVLFLYSRWIAASRDFDFVVILESK